MAEEQDSLKRVGAKANEKMALRQLTATDHFIEFMAGLPLLDEIAAYTMSDEAQERIRVLLDANHNRRLTDAENAELDEYERLGRMIRRAKIRAFKKIDETESLVSTKG